MSTRPYIPTVEEIRKASVVLDEILEMTPYRKNDHLSSLYDPKSILRERICRRCVLTRSGELTIRSDP